MISLIIPPGDQIARVNKMLTGLGFSSLLLVLFDVIPQSDEAGTASNIKSRVNRLSVLGAITSTQQKLKQARRSKKRNDVCLTPICSVCQSPDEWTGHLLRRSAQRSRFGGRTIVMLLQIIFCL